MNPRAIPAAAPPSIAVLLLAVLALSACGRRPVPAEYGEYVGHWRGDGVRLVITADGYGDYERVRGNRRETVTGTASAFSADGFRIGPGRFGTDVPVRDPPHLREGRWRLVLADGTELARVEILPIPGD